MSAVDRLGPRPHVHADDKAVDLLTDEELEAIGLMARVAGLLAVIVADGPTAEQDVLELHHHVHAIQRTIGSQAAARAYPDRFRMLGATLGQVSDIEEGDEFDGPVCT